MKTIILATVTIAIFTLGACSISAQQVEFNYNGRVKVHGQPFDGDGLFKFALTNKDGSVVYWANDNETFDGGEPTTAVRVRVQQGFFSVIIGDAATSGMAPLDASLFNETDRVVLATWFSDGAHGFERLAPDTDVVNPALLGSQSLRETDVYVDPTIGNDKYTGLRSGKPKKTIQSAWDSLPPLVRRNVTIHLAAGAYRETGLTLTGKTAAGGSVIAIEGNTTTPSLARLSGATETSPTTPVREGVVITQQQSVEIRGVQFEYFLSYSVYLTNSAGASLRDCKFIGSQNYLIYIAMYSKMDAYNLDMDGIDQNSTVAAITVCYMSHATLTHYDIRNCRWGCWMTHLSQVVVQAQTPSSVRDCQTAYIAWAGAEMTWNGGAPPPLSLVQDCSTGFDISGNSVCYYSQNWNQYVNVVTHTKTDTGGQIIN